MRIREPKTTALVFASGKVVVTGAKSEDDSRLAARKYARIIQKLGFETKFTDFKIQNIVGSVSPVSFTSPTSRADEGLRSPSQCDVKFPIRLEGLAFSHGHFSSYEPEVSDPSPLLPHRRWKLTKLHSTSSSSPVSFTEWSNPKSFSSFSSLVKSFSLVPRYVS